MLSESGRTTPTSQDSGRLGSQSDRGVGSLGISTILRTSGFNRHLVLQVAPASALEPGESGGRYVSLESLKFKSQT
eukprot:g27549.t1